MDDGKVCSFVAMKKSKRAMKKSEIAMNAVKKRHELVVHVKVVYVDNKGLNSTHLPYVDGWEIRQNTLDSLVNQKLLTRTKEEFEGHGFKSIRYIYRLPR